jgi:hypothetical protein
MNISNTIEQYNEDYIYFSEPIKNNIMTDSNFIRIIYSTPYFILNGIYLHITIDYQTVDKYFNKYKCTFDTTVYKELINKVKEIEETIIRKANICNKIPQYKIYEQLKSGFIKIFCDNENKINNTFLLKISGIWETDKMYGLTYKFINL